MDCSEFYPSSLSTSFLQQSIAVNPNQSVVISPISITILLAMLHAGASPKTETYEELSRILTGTANGDSSQLCVTSYYAHMWDSLKNDPALKTAIGVYVNRGDFKFTDKYRTIVERIYGAKMRELKFNRNPKSSAKIINADIAKQTDQQIKEIVNTGSVQNARMVLTSAASFFAKWKFQFDPDTTFKRKFYPLNQGAPQQVETMQQLFDSIPYFEDSDESFKFVGLPYEGSSAMMYFLLPNSIYGIYQILDMVHREYFLNKSYKISDLIKNAKPRSVWIGLPKFNITTSLDVKSVLTAIGVKNIFDRPDFSSISKNAHGLSISSFRQKAFINVNEVGTKAGAVTAVAFTNRLGGAKIFKADHPFAYFLTVNTPNGPEVVFNGLVASIGPVNNNDQSRDNREECNIQQTN